MASKRIDVLVILQHMIE